MDYAMIGKIEKAKRYAEERERIQFSSFQVTIRGENSVHTVSFKDGEWDSDASYFRSHGYSSHTMAMERVLEKMIPSRAASTGEYHMDSSAIGKIEKAKRYAEERDRIQFSSFEASIRGENNTHTVTFENGNWNCTCNFFHTHEVCSHTMAMERVLDKMVPSHSSGAGHLSEAIESEEEK